MLYKALHKYCVSSCFTFAKPSLLKRILGFVKLIVVPKFHSTCVLFSTNSWTLLLQASTKDTILQRAVWQKEAHNLIQFRRRPWKCRMPSKSSTIRTHFRQQIISIVRFTSIYILKNSVQTILCFATKNSSLAFYLWKNIWRGHERLLEQCACSIPQ
jgi:hypothetical protein